MIVAAACKNEAFTCSVLQKQTLNRVSRMFGAMRILVYSPTQVSIPAFCNITSRYIFVWFQRQVVMSPNACVYHQQHGSKTLDPTYKLEPLQNISRLRKNERCGLAKRICSDWEIEAVALHSIVWLSSFHLRFLQVWNNQHRGIHSLEILNFGGATQNPGRAGAYVEGKKFCTSRFSLKVRIFHKANTFVVGDRWDCGCWTLGKLCLDGPCFAWCMWPVMMFNVLFSKARIAFDTLNDILTYSDSKCIYQAWIWWFLWMKLSAESSMGFAKNLHHVTRWWIGSISLEVFFGTHTNARCPTPKSCLGKWTKWTWWVATKRAGVQL